MDNIINDDTPMTVLFVDPVSEYTRTLRWRVKRGPNRGKVYTWTYKKTIDLRRLSKSLLTTGMLHTPQFYSTKHHLENDVPNEVDKETITVRRTDPETGLPVIRELPKPSAYTKNHTSRNTALATNVLVASVLQERSRKIDALEKEEMEMKQREMQYGVNRYFGKMAKPK